MATLSAAARVFGITELVEAILERLESSESSDTRASKKNEVQPVRHIVFQRPKPIQIAPPPVIQLFSLQRVNRRFYTTITGSKILLRKLTLSKYSSNFHFGTTLDSFKSAVDKKISKAWQTATCYPESWKFMEVNGPDQDSDFMVFSHTATSTGYDEIYETDSDTTLGMLLDWERSLEARTPEEHKEVVTARRARKERILRERKERMRAYGRWA